MPDKKQVGVVGEKEAVLAFRALGMRVIAAEDTDSVEHAVQKLVHEGVPLIFITERALSFSKELVAHYQGDSTVSISPIPGAQGTDGTGMRRVKANVEKAIGADILFNTDKEEK